PRATCLVETGEDYFELRGVQVAGRARRVEDPAGGLEIGRGVARGGGGGAAGAGGGGGGHPARQAGGCRGGTGRVRALGPPQAHPVPRRLPRRPGRRATIARAAPAAWLTTNAWVWLEASR